MIKMVTRRQVARAPDIQRSMWRRGSKAKARAARHACISAMLSLAAAFGFHGCGPDAERQGQRRDVELHTAALNTCTASPPGETVRVNFQDAATTPPPGHLADFGESYGARSGPNQGTNRTYGWVTPATRAPLSLVGNGRNRGVAGELRRVTLMHMQGDDPFAERGYFNGVAQEGAWEFAIANGSYDVTIGLGDPSNTDSTHGVKVESVAAISGFVPTSANLFVTGTVRVVVTDGRLTVLPTGTNTKIAFAELTPVAAAADCNIQINFQSAAAATPSGYAKDFGQPFGARTGAFQGSGLSYGWVHATTRAPVDLSVGGSTPGNGRDRGTPDDRRLATLMHMQGGQLAAAGNYNGTGTDGAWEIGLPVGTYQVMVSVGDGAHLDSNHRVTVEGQVAIAGFTPTAAERFRSTTVTVSVTDGRLTLDATGGTNTKLTHVHIAPSTGLPRVTASTPSNGSTSVFRDTAVALDVLLPSPGRGVDGTTLNAPNLTLVRTSDGAQVPFRANTSAGGDVIVATPVALLDATTTYRLSITAGVKDLAGAGFEAFSTTFTTGTMTSSNTGTVAFQKVALATATGASFTSVVIGPDGKLYASTLSGELYRWSLASDGQTGPAEVLNSLISHEGGARVVLGLVFDPASTADNLVLWVSHGAPSLSAAPEWSGKLSRLSGPALGTVTDFVTGLPRSIRDHLTNSIAFGPDGALYVLQGSNSAMGAPDGNWGNRPEQALTAALLRVNLAAIATPPLNVQTEGGANYNPFAAGVPLTVYASGIRNPYDLLFHSNGHLYVPTNGSATPGNTPGTPATLPARCGARIDAAFNGPWTGPSVPAMSINTSREDYLFRVVAGGYYGHPNPVRCEWVLNGGNPTSASGEPGEVDQYPVGTLPDRNWRGFAFNFQLHQSPNGIIEYKSNVFGSRLRGKMIVIRYSSGKDIVVLTPGANGDVTAPMESGMAGMTSFDSPLDLVENVANGSLYVTELGGQKVTLLRPVPTP